MNLEAAEVLLASCKRVEIDKHDGVGTEIYWSLNGVDQAIGFVNRSLATVHILRWDTRFISKEARDLMFCGQLDEVWRPGGLRA